MANVVDTLITEFKMRNGGYVQGAKQIVRSTSEIVGTVASIGSVIGGSALTLFGVQAVQVAADFDGLRLGLKAVAGSTEEAEAQFVRLKDVAKLPGLGIEEAVRGSIALQAAGLSAGTAEDALRGFGNALATVGRGKDDLDGVILALGQIASKGSVSAEEINQIAERVPQIRKVMQQAFGTANTEEIQKLGISSTEFIERVVKGLKSLPVVAGGVRNTLENFGDSVKAAMEQIGSSVVKKITPGLEQVGNYVSYLADSGKLRKITADFLSLFGVGRGNNTLVKILVSITSWLETAPTRIKGFANSFVRELNNIRAGVITLSSIMIGAFASQGIVRGVAALVTAFVELRKALQGISVTAALLQALGGPKGIAIAVGAVAIAAGVAFGLDKLIPQVGPIPFQNENGGSASVGAEAAMADYNKWLRQIGDPNAPPSYSTLMSQVADALKKSQLPSFLAGIEKNTADTARNTRQDSMAGITIGGGELARRGLDKTELARVLRPRSMSSDPGLREIQTLITQLAVVIHENGQRSAERLMLERARAAC